MFKNQTPPENNQDAFNRVWQHFVVEKNPQSAMFSGCVYRDVDRDKNPIACAIGIMIPDHLLKDSVMTYGVESLFRECPLIKEWFGNVRRDLLLRMQDIHDSCFKNFEDEMRLIAPLFNVTVPS